MPYSGLRKGGLLHKHSRQHATKTQCWSSCKDPPFPTPPACPPASTSATSTASTTCLPHLPPTLLPTPRPACLLSYSLPAYTTRRGGPVSGGLPLPRPALLLRSPTTDLATLIDSPFDYRKRRRKRPTTFFLARHFPCLASWIVCALARPLLTTAACDPPPRHCSSSPPSPPSSPLSRFLCLIPKVHPTRPKPPRRRLSHCPPARTCPPTSRPG